MSHMPGLTPKRKQKKEERVGATYDVEAIKGYSITLADTFRSRVDDLRAGGGQDDLFQRVCDAFACRFLRGLACAERYHAVDPPAWEQRLGLLDCDLGRVVGHHSAISEKALPCIPQLITCTHTHTHTHHSTRSRTRTRTRTRTPHDRRTCTPLHARTHIHARTHTHTTPG